MVYIANSERTTSKVIGWTCPYKQSKLNSFKRNHDKAVACFKWKFCRGGILYPKSFDTQLRIVVFTKQKLLKRKKEIAVRKKNKNPCVCLKISLIYASFHFRLYIPFPCKINITRGEFLEPFSLYDIQAMRWLSIYACCKTFWMVMYNEITHSCSKITSEKHTIHEFKELLTLLFPMFPFDPPENIRKPLVLVFDVFRRLKREHWKEKG